MPIVKCSGRDENLWNEKWSFNFWAATGQTAVFVDFVRTVKPIKGWRREGGARVENEEDENVFHLQEIPSVFGYF